MSFLQAFVEKGAKIWNNCRRLDYKKTNNTLNSSSLGSQVFAAVGLLRQSQSIDEAMKNWIEKMQSSVFGIDFGI